VYAWSPGDGARRGLRHLAREHAVAPETALLAAYQVLLHRYTGQQHVAVGVLVPTGPRRNVRVIRTDLSGDPDVHTMLGRVAAALSATAGRSPARDAGVQTLPEALFNWGAVDADPAALPCDVCLTAAETADGWTGRFHYDGSLFEEATAARMAGHLETVLEGMAADPRRSLSSVPVLTAEERHRVLVGWNDTRVDFPPGDRVHTLFEAQVRRTPGAPAVVSDGQTLTYEELNRRVNRLARQLTSLAVGPEVRVALLAEDPLRVVVAMLAVLKAGGAYVPLDTAAPPERQRLILEDSRASVVLTERRLAGDLPEVGARVVCLDAGDPPADDHRDTDLDRDVPADALAYVIYTSGSTGRPKGVMVPHRGICNTLRWRLATFPTGPGDRALQPIPFEFDASVCATFAPLAAGACLFLVPPADRRDPAALVRLIATSGITELTLPPARLRLLLEERGLEACRTLRQVITGAEAVTVPLQERFFARLGAGLANLYGPTEVSVDATWWPCRRDGGPDVVPIGRPIANVRAYVLDALMRPVPAGVPGELYVGGAGLARGYLDAPALTAERFVPDPFGPEPGARLYRTGDRARWRADGNLEFLGRADHQVKVRGVRVEPGEVEAALAKHPGVREAVVLAREYAPGDRRLVAYVAAAADGLSERDLRAYLRGRLPEYMVPSAFVIVAALPRGINGKVDPRALPDAAALRVVAATDRNGTPRTPLEEYLARVWEGLLRAGRVGRDDDFFERGGDSIQAAVLAQRLQEDLGEYVYAVAVYDAPTVAALAGYLGENYPEAVARRFGPASVVRREGGANLVDETAVAALRRVIRRLPPFPGRPAEPNPPAVFILSPPRSGSTLSRVMLGGHPRLFAPPELQLLNFNTLRERRAALSGERDRFWLDGTVRALMEVRRCPAEEAARLIADCEARDLTVKEFYRLMQEGLGEATLVEKTPTYALDLGMLRRAEEDFPGARYIHLVRHPAAMIASFEEAKLHVFFPPFLTGPHPFSPRQLAELVWVVSHQNILAFLGEVPAERQHKVYFEDLVRDPVRVMEGVAGFLGLPFDPLMAEPYRQGPKSRMTDPVHPLARMLGDVKFHAHKGVDAAAAERFREPVKVPLGHVTLALAARLGYDQGANAEAAHPSRNGTAVGRAAGRPLVAVQPAGSRPPFFCVHPAGGTVFCYRELARRLGPDQPFYGLQARGLDGRHAPAAQVEEIAADYLEGIRTAQASGPYRLGGWSSGGVVAYEMAQQLTDLGEEVELLALLDTDIPRPGLTPPRLSRARFLWEFAAHCGLAVPTDKRRTPFEVQLGNVLDAAKRAGLVPADLDGARFRALLDHHLRVFRAQVRAVRRYVPRPYPGRVILVRPTAGEAAPAGRVWDWNRLATVLEVRSTPGDHYTMLREPHVGRLAGLLGEWLGVTAAAG
jgi:amino acid adenylation domain-containing protein